MSSIFVGGESGVGVGDAEALGVTVDFGVAVGVDVGAAVAVGDGVGAGVTLSTEEVGDGVSVDEVSSCGVGVLVGVAEVAAFDSVGVGVLRAPVGEDFDFGFGVGVGLGTGVCAVRSTPRWVPRPTAAPRVLAGVAEGFTRAEKNHGVGVGVDAAFNDNARPSASTELSE